MIAVRNDLIAEEVPLSSGQNGEVVCAKILMKDSHPLYVLAYYRPPKDTTSALDSLDQALEELQTLVDKNPRACLIVGGDFNAPGVDWTTNTVKPD